MNWSDLVAPGICQLTPYKAGVTSAQLRRQYGLKEIHKFNSNESPVLPSPKVVEAITRAANTEHLYPDYYDLKSTLAGYLSVKHEQLLLGNGSIDVIELACRLVAQPGKFLLCSQYGYSAYPLIAKACGLNTTVAPSDIEFGHNVDVLIERCNENTAVLVIDAPTNMAGKSIDILALNRLFDSVPATTLIILDQAYIEFTQGDLAQKSLQLVEHYPNLLVTRTFSKAFGLAGMRVGYGIANAELISWLSRIQRPFPVSGIGVAAALAALDDKSYIETIRANVLSGRVAMANQFRELGFNCFEGEGNFVLLHIGPSQAQLTESLMKNGFIVRPLNAFNMSEYVRVSVAGQTSMHKLLAAFTCLS